MHFVFLTIVAIVVKVHGYYGGGSEESSKRDNVHT